MKTQTITIDPSYAAKLLELNTNNRPISKLHVSVLAREMKSGRWKSNGDTIRVGNSRLLDGQHRLMAIIESGCSITTLLVSDLTDDVFDTIDNGKRRSAADSLAIRGEVCTTDLAAALAVVGRYTSGRANTTHRFTTTEIAELLEKHPSVRDSVSKTFAHQRLIARSLLAGCHYLFAQKDQEAADQFVIDLITGQNLKKDDPVYVLREKLVSNMLAKAKLPRPYIMAVTIKAWNARRKKCAIRLLKFSSTAESPELFPEVE